MPRVLENVLQVIAPCGYSNKSKQIPCNGGILNRTIQDVLSNNTNPSNTHHINQGCGNLQVIGKQKNHAIGRRKSGMVYEYSKLCKTVNYLPNPMSRMLYDGMHHINEKADQQVTSSENSVCHPCHHGNHEPPYDVYYSPGPSQIYLNKKDLYAKAIKKEKVQNMTRQAPISCVDVFLQKSVSYESALTFLLSYGDIQSVVQVGERSYRVVFADLVGACNAVNNSTNQTFMKCFWHHKRLSERKFRRKRNRPIYVITEPLYLGNKST